MLGKSIGLEERAAKIGGRHLMNDPQWDQTLLQAISDSSTRISVTLDDVEGDTVYQQVMRSVQRWSSGSGTPFDYEMAQLYDSGILGEINFWKGGMRVDNPFTNGG